MRRRPGLGGTAVALILGATVAIGLLGVPADRLQGDVQRIMYVHVPAAWLAYLAFFVTLVGSLGYLIRRDLRFDRLAAAMLSGGALKALIPFEDCVDNSLAEAAVA